MLIYLILSMLSPWSEMDYEPQEWKETKSAVERKLNHADLKCKWISEYHARINKIGNGIVKAEDMYYDVARSYKVLVVICSYCRSYIDVKDPQGVNPNLSHGICPLCHEKLMRDLAKMRTKKEDGVERSSVGYDKVMGGA